MKCIGIAGLLLVFGFSFSANADSVLVDFDRNWIFPQNFGGLEYEISEKYEDADFGYRIVYRAGEAFEAEVTIYDLGLESIPDGCKGEGIDMVLQSVDDALKLRSKQEQIKNLKKLRSSIISKEGVLKFSTTVSSYEEAELKGEGKLQATYVTSIQKQFVRLQFTFDRPERIKAQEMANEMMVQLTKMVMTQPTEEEVLMASCSIFLNDPASYGGLTAAKYLMDKASTMGNLNVYTHLFVWPTSYWSKPKNANLLIAAYFAGMLQVVVPQELDEGGEFEAFVAMLETYEKLRAKDQIDDISEFSDWVKNPDRRALFDQLLIVE